MKFYIEGLEEKVFDTIDEACLYCDEHGKSYDDICDFKDEEQWKTRSLKSERTQECR